VWDVRLSSNYLSKIYCHFNYILFVKIRLFFSSPYGFWQPFVKRFTLCYQSVCHVCNIGVLWPKGWMDQEETWHAAYVCCDQMAGCIKMPLGMEVGLGPGDFPLDGDPTPPSPRRQQSPHQFSAHVCCSKTAWWMKMAFGVEVSLGPGHTVLDGDPAHIPKKRDRDPQIFCPFLLWPNSWMHQNATWYSGRPQPRRLCVRWGPSSPLPKKGHSPTIFGRWLLWPNHFMYQDTSWYGSRPQPRRHCVRWGPAPPPNFQPVSVVAKWLDGLRYRLVWR